MTRIYLTFTYCFVLRWGAGSSVTRVWLNGWFIWYTRLFHLGLHQRTPKSSKTLTKKWESLASETKNTNNLRRHQHQITLFICISNGNKEKYDKNQHFFFQRNVWYAQCHIIIAKPHNIFFSFFFSFKETISKKKSFRFSSKDKPL